MINSSIYNGQVIHKRFKPKIHYFKYNVFSLLIDLSELDQLDKKINLFSYNRFNLVSFYDKDHGDRNGTSLIEWVNKNLEKNKISTQNISIKLLCYPRIFGFVFNPLSVFYVYDQSKQLIAILYEVKNTFGEQHTYIFRVEEDNNLIQNNCSKKFHVSPFNPMGQRYVTRALWPRESDISIYLGLQNDDSDHLMFEAGLSLRLTPFDGHSIKPLFTGIWPQSLIVIGGIYREAFALWRKGLRYHPHP